MSWLFHPEVLVLGLVSSCLILVLMLAFTSGVRYQISYDRLPAATRLQELEVLVGGEEARLQEVREQLKRAEVALSERDQAEAEAEFWRTEVQTALAEYEALADQRREIEKIREEYRQAIEELTLAETQLREIKAEAEQSRIQAEAANDRVVAAEERLLQIAAEEETLQDDHVDLHDAVAALERQLIALKEEKSSVAVELERARERLLALVAETDDLVAGIARLTSEKEKAEEELAALRRGVDALSAKRAEIEEVEGLLADLVKKMEALELSVDEKQREESRLQARIAKLEEEFGAASAPGDTPTDDRSLADLIVSPACLATERVGGGFEVVQVKPQAAEQEADALQRVMKHLEEAGFEFPARTVNAFHTSLKTAVISPLTVLAGISGTGKSQLPRYYADAMGIHFLKIPVQPRWDSPQDLFGFYNYIESRYKATDLARALVHLDSHNWPDEAEDYGDRMLLVLLDEMNLARVEYYFSEFLSRLEGRPFDESSMSEGDRRQSEIDIDVSRAGQPKRVYAGQNVLFAGTMNEDESTLALSDKVLDRANVLRFPKPEKIKDTLPASRRKYAASGYLPMSRWIGNWTREADRLDANRRDTATSIIARINDVMSELGHPFGHRMGQAMLHYVANYPARPNRTDNADQVNFALADQIELRILPRLRGVVVDEYNRYLRDLADLADQSLNDGSLAEEIKKCVDRSRETNGLFVWRGFTRQV